MEEFQPNLFLLCLVFVTVVITKILKNSTGLVCKTIIYMVYPEPVELVIVKKEIDETRKHLRSINQMEDFAEYSRITRSLQQKEIQLNRITKSYKEKVMTCSTITRGMWNFLILSGRIALIVTYRSIPVLVMSPDALWPLASIISFPTGIPGGVGHPAWSIMCTLVVDAVTG